MNFYEILADVIAILQREGRTSYRGLKRQFDLDDDYLEDLKVELIEVKQFAVDQDGKMLVWIGETAGTAVTASQPAPALQPPPIKQGQPTPDAERRQLTVMFCDLADSTKLSGQLDPEDLREVIRAYQETAAGVIQRYDAHIAQYLGDGLLVYFGWPQAHEDDAQRGVRSGLGILEAMDKLNTRLEQDKGVRLAVRIGIHTGPVVIGEMGGGGRHERLALGETTNIAARLEGMAQPNTVVISDMTYRLVEGYFNCDDLGPHELKGVAVPVQIYQVHQGTGVQGRLDVAISRGLTPLVGREQEVGLLLERWTQVKDGQGQVVLLSGEGGIGKSRLIQVLKEHIADEPHTRWECRSSPFYQNTALYPITDLFQRTLQFQADDTPKQRLEELEQELSQYRLPLEESIPLVAPLLSLSIPENRYPPLALSPQRQRQKTLEAIVAILLEQAEQQPVLFILEDLHWTDPTTLEFVNLLIDQVPTAALCALLTCRPTFQPTWGLRAHISPIAVNRLNHTQIEIMAERVAGGKTLPAEVLQRIVERTDGVPLFVEELTKAILESGHLKETNEHYELTGTLPALAIPTTLQDSLMARLDRLVTAKAVAQYAAVIGRQFSYALLQAVSQVDASTLQRELGRLVEAELVYQRGLPPQATYLFKHALVADAAYQSLLKSTRQQYHQRIAQTLKERFPETAETQPELLAHHYAEAGLHEQAVGYWQKAGQRAVERSANVEAIAHLTQGLEALKTLPDNPDHLQQELFLLTTLGPALMVIKGQAAPEIEQVYARAYTLCQQAGETSQLFSVLWGLRKFYSVRGVLETGHELAEQLLVLAQQTQDRAYLLEAHGGLGLTLCGLGALHASREHFEQAIALYDAQQDRSHAFRYGIDPGVYCRSYISMVLWLMGYPHQASENLDEALTLAHELGHPFSLARAHLTAAWLHQFRREVQTTQEHAEKVITLSAEQGFTTYEAGGTFCRGWALAMQAQEEEGLAQLHQGLDARLATRAEAGRPRFLAQLAEVYGKAGQADEGLSLLAEAVAHMGKTGMRDHEAELHRLKGELLLQQSSDNATEAESCFYKSLEVAQSQQAKSWELRAATSLARLWQSQEKRQDAYDLLAPVYGWFTEGFDTADLQDARALLDELA